MKIIYNHITPSGIGLCVSVSACTGFPLFKLLFQWRLELLYTRHYLGPGFGYVETVLTPCLTDAVPKGVKVRGKIALRWECELLYNQNYVNVLGS